MKTACPLIPIARYGKSFAVSPWRLRWTSAIHSLSVKYTLRVGTWLKVVVLCKYILRYNSIVCCASVCWYNSLPVKLGITCDTYFAKSWLRDRSNISLIRLSLAWYIKYAMRCSKIVVFPLPAHPFTMSQSFGFRRIISFCSFWIVAVIPSKCPSLFVGALKASIKSDSSFSIS